MEARILQPDNRMTAMPERARSHLRAVLLVLAVFVIVLVGTAGGVYLGYALKGQQEVGMPPLTSAAHRPPLEPQLRFALRPGERFPNDTITAIDGSVETFDRFFDGRPTVLLFWSLSCDPCLEQARLWKTHMEPAITVDVKQVVCLARDTRIQVLEQHAEILSKKTVVLVNLDRLRELYNLVLSPTIVALDGQGFIVHIQYEQSQSFDRELFAFLTGK